jgi:hypothetical protein
MMGASSGGEEAPVAPIARWAGRGMIWQEAAAATPDYYHVSRSFPTEGFPTIEGFVQPDSSEVQFAADAVYWLHLLKHRLRLPVSLERMSDGGRYRLIPHGGLQIDRPPPGPC